MSAYLTKEKEQKFLVNLAVLRPTPVLPKGKLPSLHSEFKLFPNIYGPIVRIFLAKELCLTWWEREKITELSPQVGSRKI